jgi:hypothetical protein
MARFIHMCYRIACIFLALAFLHACKKKDDTARQPEMLTNAILLDVRDSALTFIPVDTVIYVGGKEVTVRPAQPFALHLNTLADESVYLIKTAKRTDTLHILSDRLIDEDGYVVAFPYQFVSSFTLFDEDSSFTDCYMGIQK